MWHENQSQSLFIFQRLVYSKEPEEMCMLILTNVDCLFPKLFSTMYFLCYAEAFDDVMIFEYLKFETLIFSKMKKTFFIFSQQLSFRIEKKKQQKCSGHSLLRYVMNIISRNKTIIWGFFKYSVVTASFAWGEWMRAPTFLKPFLRALAFSLLLFF